MFYFSFLELRMFYTMFLYKLLFMMTTISLIESHVVTFCLLNYTTFSGSNCMCNSSCVLRFNYYEKESDGCLGTGYSSTPCTKDCVNPQWSCPSCQGPRSAVQINHCVDFDIDVKDNMTIKMDIYRCWMYITPQTTPESLCTDVFHIDEVSTVKSLYTGSYRVWYRFNTTEILTTTTDRQTTATDRQTTATDRQTTAIDTPSDTPTTARDATTTVSDVTEKSSVAGTTDSGIITAQYLTTTTVQRLLTTAVKYLTTSAVRFPTTTAMQYVTTTGAQETAFPMEIVIGATIAGIIFITCMICIVFRWKKHKEKKIASMTKNDEQENTGNNSHDNAVSNDSQTEVTSSKMPFDFPDINVIPGRPPLDLAPLGKVKLDSSQHDNQENNAKSHKKKKKRDSSEYDDEEKKAKKRKKKKKKRRKKEIEDLFETKTAMTLNASYSKNNDDLTPVCL